MVQRSGESPLDVHAVRVARKRVRQLVGARGLTRADRKDLEQEILLEVVRRLPRFDPVRGKRESFVARVVDHTVANLIEHREAPCRDWRRCGVSLDDLVTDQEGRRVERWRTLDDEACRARRGLGVVAAEQTDLRLDVAAAVASLPADLRATCEALARGTVHHASRTTGVPRRTLRGRLARIQAHFVARGLGAYAGHPTPVSPTAPVRKQRGHGAASHGRTA